MMILQDLSELIYVKWFVKIEWIWSWFDSFISAVIYISTQFILL